MGSAVNRITFHKGTFRMLETYDLGGIQIQSMSLPWSPYLIQGNCKDDGKTCDSEGYLIDILEMARRLFNFTYVSLRDPNNDWGVTPKSGPYNRSGVWGGVMGGVINGQFDMSLSAWQWVFNRVELVSFTTVVRQRSQLVLTPQPPKVDVLLYIRPFTDESWGAIGAIMVVMLVCLIFPYLVVRHVESTAGHQMIVLFSWYFFILLNAYYGGAMTMFFTSEATLPFETMKDVIRAYPGWKLLMQSGNEITFISKALDGDQDFNAFLDRIRDKPSETVFTSIEDGLAKLEEGPYVIHVQMGMLKGFFRANPYHNQRLKVFATEKPRLDGLIFPLNSPVKEVMKLAMSRLFESGGVEYLLDKWEGRGIPQVTGKVTPSGLAGFVTEKGNISEPPNKSPCTHTIRDW